MLDVDVHLDIWIEQVQGESVGLMRDIGECSKNDKFGSKIGIAFVALKADVALLSDTVRSAISEIRG